MATPNLTMDINDKETVSFVKFNSTLLVQAIKSVIITILSAASTPGRLYTL